MEMASGGFCCGQNFVRIPKSIIVIYIRINLIDRKRTQIIYIYIYIYIYLLYLSF